MPEEAKKETEAELRDDGIFYDLSGGYWILMTKSWGLNDAQDFLRADNLGKLKLLVERTKNWSLPDIQFQPIPYDRAAILARIEAHRQWELKGTSEQSKIILKGLEDSTRGETRFHETVDRAKVLLGTLEVLVGQVQAPTEALFVIPTALQARLSTAFIRCYHASFNVPFESLLPSSPPPESTPTTNANA